MNFTLRRRPLWLVLVLILAVSGCTLFRKSPAPTEGEFMVVAANQLAAQAGQEILADGGSAVDAIIAVQMVLTLVEPQSSGIGGGALMMYWKAKDGTLEAWDGRETAPAYVQPNHFLDENGNPYSMREAVLGGKSVGVPGVVAMLEDAHREHGRLPWSRLFEPAIRLAENGFPVSPRLNRMLQRYIAPLPAGQDMRAYFFGEDGEPHPVGHLLKNPEYAKTLRRIAKGGARAFHEGPVAETIVERVRTAPSHPGGMTLADLRDYEPKRREPVCRPYRVWRVCGFPPPTSGGIAILQILTMLERFDFAAMEPGGLLPVHLTAEASRLAYADRAQYLADPDFVEVPVEGLLDRTYLADRSRLIDPARSMGKARAGTPPGAAPRTPDQSPEYPGTSHAVIVDAEGNVVSITMTIEYAFGSQLMAAGFILNNELTDFAFQPEKDGRPVANAPRAGKRPRSSMSPMIVFDQAGKPVLALGSAGGARIPLDVLQSMIAVLDWGMTPDEAFALPHYGNQNGPVLLEEHTPAEELKPGLVALGHEVEVKEMDSGLHGILFTEEGAVGGVDPRREGAALGGTRK